jgi:hypothetical protein
MHSVNSSYIAKTSISAKDSQIYLSYPVVSRIRIGRSSLQQNRDIRNHYVATPCFYLPHPAMSAPPIAVFGVIAGAADAAGAAGAAVAGAAGAVGGAVAGAVGSASAGAAGAAVLSGVAAGATTAGIDHIHKRGFRFDKQTSSNITSSDIFTTCIADAPGASSKAYLLVGHYCNQRYSRTSL